MSKGGVALPRQAQTTAIIGFAQGEDPRMDLWREGSEEGKGSHCSFFRLSDLLWVCVVREICLQNGFLALKEKYVCQSWRKHVCLYTRREPMYKQRDNSKHRIHRAMSLTRDHENCSLAQGRRTPIVLLGTVSPAREQAPF